MITNNDRIDFAWSKSKQQWPPRRGDKVRIFKPKDHRGYVAAVIATDSDKSPKSTRFAPLGKIRVSFKGIQFTVGKHDVFPREFTEKQLMTMPYPK